MKQNKQEKQIKQEYVRYTAETTGWSNDSSWFPVYELSFDTEEEARDAIIRHKKTFHGNINYRIMKITTTKEQLKLK